LTCDAGYLRLVDRTINISIIQHIYFCTVLWLQAAMCWIRTFCCSSF